MQHRFVGIAFAVFFQNGFADHLGGHLLLARQVVGVGEAAVIIHRRVDRQPVFATHIIVFQTVAGRDVDKAGARRVFHKIIAREQFSGALAKRMLIFETTQIGGIQRADNLMPRPTALLGHHRQEDGGNDVILPAHADE